MKNENIYMKNLIKLNEIYLARNLDLARLWIMDNILLIIKSKLLCIICYTLTMFFKKILQTFFKLKNYYNQF